MWICAYCETHNDDGGIYCECCGKEKKVAKPVYKPAPPKTAPARPKTAPTPTKPTPAADKAPSYTPRPAAEPAEKKAPAAPKPVVEKKEEKHSAIEDEFLKAPVHDTGSIWLAILSFLLPILGLVGAFVFRHFNYIRNFKACRKGAIIGFIFNGVFLLLLYLI